MNGEVIDRSLYEYNSNKKFTVEEKLLRNSDNLWVNYIRFEYDGNDRVSHVVPAPTSEAEDELWYKYDKNGNITEYVAHSRGNKIKEQYIYDSNNKKTQVRFLHEDDILVSLSRYTYNSKNQCIETIITGPDRERLRLRTRMTRRAI